MKERCSNRKGSPPEGKEQDVDQATTTWWVLFPLKGLAISDEELGLDHAMFGDATILSKSHLRHLIRLLKLNERMPPGHDHESTILYFMERGTSEEESHSILAVRRRGPAELHQPHAGKLPGTHADPLGADHRAAGIAALLAVGLLVDSREWRTCGLVSQIHRQWRFVSMVSPETGGISLGLASGRACTRLKPALLSRSEVLERLDSGRLRPLTEVLAAQRPSVPRSLSRAVTESAIRLSAALHVPSSSSQLLGAVTSIEILIGASGESFDTFAKRLQVLAGKDACEYYDADTVLEERHRYVHRGIEPAHGMLPLRALALAVVCLLEYAKLARLFPNRATVLRYLDFHHLGRQLVEQWSPQERSSFESLAKHHPSDHRFAFFEQPKGRTDEDTPSSS